MAYSNRRIVIGFAAVIVVSFGAILYGFSVYVTDEAAGADFSTGILSAALTGAGIAAAGLARPLGRVMDRHGARGVTVAGSVLGGAGLVAFSQSTENWQVLAVWWLIIGPATAAIYYEPAMVGIAAWVPPHLQSKAFGTLTFIGGLSAAIFIPLAERLVSGLGWRAAVQVMAALVVVTGVVASLVAIPAGVGTHAVGSSRAPAKVRELLTDRRFVLFTLALMLGFLSVQGLIAHRVNRFTETGFPIALVAAWAGGASIISMPGRYFAPVLADRFKATSVTALVFSLLGVSILLAVPGESDASLIGHFTLFGVAFGAIVPLRAVVMTRWYAGDRYGQISGTQLGAMLLVAAFGPVIVGFGRDVAGSYRPVLVALGCATLIGAYLTWLAGRVEARSTESIP